MWLVLLCACCCHGPRTPCIPRIFDALPPESRSGRVQLLIPAGGLSASSAASTAGVAPLFDDQHTSAAVVHLAATGDHSFSRRIRLAAPLLKQVMTATGPSRCSMLINVSLSESLLASAMAYLWLVSCCQENMAQTALPLPYLPCNDPPATITD